MEILQKSAITVSYGKSFIDWNNKMFPELPMEEDMLGESSTYLVSGGFEDPDKLISKYFKQIFKNELTTINADEKTWPESLTLDLFEKWFFYEISDFVVELED